MSSVKRKAFARRQVRTSRGPPQGSGRPHRSTKERGRLGRSQDAYACDPSGPSLPFPLASLRREGAKCARSPAPLGTAALRTEAGFAGRRDERLKFDPKPLFPVSWERALNPRKPPLTGWGEGANFAICGARTDRQSERRTRCGPGAGGDRVWTMPVKQPGRAGWP